MKTYQEVIAFLYEQYPTYQNKGINAYKPDLSNIIKLCEIVGNPQKNIKTIHVAGTNGKGSVCNYLTNIYTDSGYRVGTFSSPHLIDFRERITINQNFIEKEFPKLVNTIEVNLIENEDNFTDDEWNNLYKLSEETFVEESDSLKEGAAGAGLTDNDW